MKTTNYFSHDSNSRNDEKLLAVRMRLGAEGYGVYFMILERLREEVDYMSVKDYNLIAFDLRVSSSVIKSVIEDFGLFEFYNEKFYSTSFIKRMQKKDEVSKKRAESGKKGLQKRWGKVPENQEVNSKAIANATKNDSKVIANATNFDSKESKVKESKVKGKEKEKKEKKIPPEKKSEVNMNNSQISFSLPAERVEIRGGEKFAFKEYPDKTSHKPLSELERIMLSDEQQIYLVWKNNKRLRYGLTKEDVAAAIFSFFRKLEDEGVTEKTLRDARAHFARWWKLELEKQKQNEGNWRLDKKGKTSFEDIGRAVEIGRAIADTD